MYAEFALFLIPYLIAVLVAIAVFRASGAMDFLIDGIRMGVSAAGLDTQFVEGLPTMLMKPLSGSGARGMMLDAMNTYGADSFIGRLCSIVQGSSDTTSTSSPFISAVSESATPTIRSPVRYWPI